jgi:hypothetical protein
VISDQTMQIRGERQRLLGRLQARGGARLTIVSRADQKPIGQR